MKKAYMVKFQTKQGGSGASVTTQVMANSSSEAKSIVQSSHPGCKILSCIEK